MREFSIKNFSKGTIDTIEDFSIPEEAASRSINWPTLGDKIELTGGYKVIGTEAAGTGRVTGLKIAEKVDGTLLPIRTHGKKIDYYDTDWNEAGTDKLGTAADGEDVAITTYTSSAGYQAWLSSPNSGLFKMMLANPEDVEDNYNAVENFKGYIYAQNGRLHLWNRLNNKNYLYGSYKDVQNSVVYTTVTSEAIGAAPGPTYSGTLAAVTGVRTCFSVVITDGTKTVQDDKKGLLTGDGTGTINYTTGAYSVTFDGATIAPVTANYQWEDSTEKGIADFTFSATRLATEGFFLPQPTGGDIKNMLFYKQNAYIPHQSNFWVFNISLDDLDVTNEVFRENIGMPNWRAAIATGEGIYFLDNSDPAKPRFKLLTLDSNNAEVVPIVISFNIDLSSFDFSQCVAHKWGDYLLFSCKTADSDNADRVFAYNTQWKSFDMTNYFASCFDNYNGALWVGDSASDNVYQAFTGFASNDALIENYWEGKLSQIGVDEIKKFKRLTLRGKIGPDQSIRVSISYDGGSFSELGTVDGDGDYVSASVATTLGSPQVGELELGGGGNGIEAYDYVREFRVRSGAFNEAKLRIEATSVGYASVSEINYYDIKTYGQKNLQRFRTT
jgi:hypothetical protein